MIPTARTRAPSGLPSSNAALNVELARRAEIRATINPQQALAEQLRRDVGRAELAQRISQSRQAQQANAGLPPQPKKLPVRSSPPPQRVNYGPAPVNRAYTPGANYTPGGGSSAIGARNAAAAAGATGAQAAAAARAAAPAVITPAAAARGALSGAPLIGAGLSGALSAGAIKAAGGDWWQAAGGGLGAAAGQTIGFAGGAAAGAAATVNPAGAVVGGYAGGAAGSIAGASIGAALGGKAGAIAGRIPGAGGRIGRALGGVAGAVLGGPLGGVAGGALGGALGGWLQPDTVAGSPIPDETVPTEGPAPFTGGQSPGVEYKLRLQGWTTDIGGSNGRWFNTFTASPTLIGPIRDLRITSNGWTGTFFLGWPRDFTIISWNEGTPPNQRSYRHEGPRKGTTTPPVSEPNVQIIGIVRADGQPDTGGDPPGDPVPVPAPNRPRPYNPLEALPRRAAPDNTPAPSAPAPSNPGQVPALRPSPPPSAAPAAPAPGPALPAGDPLQEPAPQGNPTASPTAAPQATPGNVPGPLGSPTANPARGLKPGETVQLTGGATVTGTETGYRVEVPLNNPNTIRLPNGDVIRPGETGTVTEEEAGDLPWWVIPALAIATGAGIGTAIALKDPTTPGEFTQPPPAPPPQSIPTPPDTGCRCNAPILQAQQAATADLNDLRQRLIRVEGNQTGPQGFAGIYAFLVEMRAKLGAVSDFAEKAWETTRIQKVLDVLTFIGVMHNVSMLSRDVSETFFYLVGQALDIVGIDDEEGNALNIGQIVGGSVYSFLTGVFGEAFVEGAIDSYRKANRIVQSASMVIWTIRSLQDTGLDLMEWIGENTGKIGNALKRFGVVGERSYPWMAESAQARDRNRARFDKVTGALENVEDRLSSYSVATSNVLEIQQETQELGENWGRFRESLNDIPDPWFSNQPVETEVATAAAASASPQITAADAER